MHRQVSVQLTSSWKFWCAVISVTWTTSGYEGLTNLLTLNSCSKRKNCSKTYNIKADSEKNTQQSLTVNTQVLKVTYRIEPSKQSACLYTKLCKFLSKCNTIIFFLSYGYHVMNSKLHTLQFSYKISKERAVTLSILQFSSSSMLIKH